MMQPRWRQLAKLSIVPGLYRQPSMPSIFKPWQQPPVTRDSMVTKKKQPSMSVECQMEFFTFFAPFFFGEEAAQLLTRFPGISLKSYGITYATDTVLFLLYLNAKWVGFYGTKTHQCSSSEPAFLFVHISRQSPPRSRIQAVCLGRN